MTSPAVGAARLPRAVLLGSVTVALALGAHAAAGGDRPGLLPLGVAMLPVGCLSLLVTARPVGRVAAAASLLAGQLGLHLWFSLTGSHGCAIATGLTGHSHAGAVVAGCDRTGPAVPPTSAATAVPGAGSGLTMLAGHLTAVLLTGLLLAHGETLLWRLTGLLGRGTPRLPGHHPVRPAPRPRPGRPRVVLGQTRALISTPRRRGPPGTVGAR